MKDKNAVDKKYKVDLSDLFKNDTDFFNELDSVKKDMMKISTFINKVCLSSENLFNVLSLDNDISLRLNSLHIYAHVNLDTDLSNSKANEKNGLVMNLYNEYSALSAYIVPEILKVDYEKIEDMIKENGNLKEFELLLKSLFRFKNHTLSKKEEELIAKLSDAFNVAEEVSVKLTDVDLKFDKIKNEEGKLERLTDVNYSKFMQSEKRDVRKAAFKTLYKGYKSINNTMGQLLSSHVKLNNNLCNARNYNGQFEASLYGNEIDTVIYSNLIKSINANMNLIHKRLSIRKKVLGYNKLFLYDLNAPIVKQDKKVYDFETSRKLVEDSLKVLGDDYSKVLKKSFDEGWIDVYPYENKRGGAYCTCAYKTHPYVLLNHDDTFNCVSTLAHELGHAMHYHYAVKNNNYANYNYSIFVAEVASQVNEILLIKHMLKATDKKDEKLYLYNELINKFAGAVSRQTMFAEFEKLIYDLDNQKIVLTNELLNEKYFKLVKKYHGKDVEVNDDIKYEWSRVPHFFYNFYTYQYATGFMASLFIAEDLFNEKENALENYLEFLSLGTTKDPVESLCVAGVDFKKEETFNKAFEIYGQLLNDFVKIYEEE